MEKFNSIDEILDFAIQREIEANQFYIKMSEKSENIEITLLFKQFANEELGHKKKLEQIKSGTLSFPKTVQRMNLKISDYMINPGQGTNLDYQDALIFAMKKEKAAFRLYINLSRFIEDSSLKNIFLSLAQEEARHKLRFEIEYDDNYYPEN